MARSRTDNGRLRPDSPEIVMKRTLFIVLALFAFAFGARAGEFRAASPEEAAAALAAFDRLSTQPQRFVCNFVQRRHTSLLEEDLVSKGKLTMDAPDSLVWAYVSPGKKSYTVDLTTDARFMAMARKQDFSREVLVGDDGTERIVLTPLKRDLKKLFTLIEVDMKYGVFTRVKMTELSGDFTLIEFTNVAGR